MPDGFVDGFFMYLQQPNLLIQSAHSNAP
jgi:hypothetical protein